MAKEESEDTPASSSAGGPSLLSQAQVAVEMQGGREGVDAGRWDFWLLLMSLL